MKHCKKCDITHNKDFCPLCSAGIIIMNLKQKLCNANKYRTDFLIKKIRTNRYNNNTISVDQLKAFAKQNNCED